MNIFCEVLPLNKSGGEDINVKQENKMSFKNGSKDMMPLSGFNNQNTNILKDDSTNGCNDVLSYYYQTIRYHLNSEEFLKNYSFKKTSRNFVRKNKMTSFNRNELNHNYNDDYINNNYKQINNCIYINKTNYINNAHNESKQFNTIFLGNNLYICNNNQIANQLQNIKRNNDCNLNGKKIDDNPLNKYINHNLNKNSVNNNIPKNILKNKIDCPPFIPSSYPKKENDQCIRKKSEDSLSKDKESDSTSAISEKREDESVNNFSKKKKNIRNIENIEQLESCDYMVEMFGRRGWICKLCNNFNYETRIKCNRCGILKKPKKLIEIKHRTEIEHNKEADWRCIICKNINYSFRSLCNRCKIPKMISIVNTNQMVNQMNFPIFQAPNPILLYK